MQLDIATTTQAITIVMFAAAAVKYLIVNPIQSALAALKEAIDKLEMMISRLECEQKGLDRRVTVVEESTKAAHRRIDVIEAK